MIVSNGSHMNPHWRLQPAVSVRYRDEVTRHEQ
jgi:hypothetical protein